MLDLRWSQKVKSRDKHCLICRTNKNLQAHHLFSKSHYPVFKEDMKNGVTLCDQHHKAFHEKFGYENTTGFQFLRWIYDQPKVSKLHKKEVFHRVLDLNDQLPKQVTSHAKDQNVGYRQSKLQAMFQKDSLGQNVLIQTSVSELEYQAFQQLCSQLNITVEQALYWLVVTEGYALLKQEYKKMSAY